MPSAPEALSDPLLLIADDEPCVREVLAQLAIRSGWRACTAHDGPSLLELAAAQPQAQAILLDARMPGPGPEALLRVLRARHPHLCLILMSGDPERTQSALADARLAKPFSAARLESVLQASLLAEVA